MKCLCFSDSHGSPELISRALLLHRDATAVFFLGDGLSDVEAYLAADIRPWYAVRGNCDTSAYADGRFVPKTLTVTLHDRRIVLTHGDLYGVKGGLAGLRALAADSSAALVLYGHTHTPHEEYSDGIYYFNPGSIAASYRSTPTYGIITVTDGGILLSHGSL